MLEVCSSLQDQQFWFLNWLISSLYERDMIKILKLKFEENLQNLWNVHQDLQQVWREGEGFKKRREKDFRGQSPWATSPSRGGRVRLTGAESPSGREPHGLPHGLGKMAHGLPHLSRALSGSLAISWASELRFWIHFWITNRDSLSHDYDYDYKTLKNGWEIISENYDEVNSMNENEK